MTEQSLGAGLAKETRPVFGVAPQLVGQDLDGHDTIETRIARLEDRAHPAPANQLQQLVFGNAAKHSSDGSRSRAPDAGPARCHHGSARDTHTGV